MSVRVEKPQLRVGAPLNNADGSGIKEEVSRPFERDIESGGDERFDGANVADESYGAVREFCSKLVYKVDHPASDAHHGFSPGGRTGGVRFPKGEKFGGGAAELNDLFTSQPFPVAKRSFRKTGIEAKVNARGGGNSRCCRRRPS